MANRPRAVWSVQYTLNLTSITRNHVAGMIPDVCRHIPGIWYEGNTALLLSAPFLTLSVGCCQCDACLLSCVCLPVWYQYACMAPACDVCMVHLSGACLVRLCLLSMSANLCLYDTPVWETLSDMPACIACLLYLTCLACLPPLPVCYARLRYLSDIPVCHAFLICLSAMPVIILCLSAMPVIIWCLSAMPVIILCLSDMPVCCACLICVPATYALPAYACMVFAQVDETLYIRYIRYIGMLWVSGKVWVVPFERFGPSPTPDGWSRAERKPAAGEVRLDHY